MDKYMGYSNKQVELTRKVYYSRMRVLSNHPFFGMLVLDLKFRFDSEEKTFSTDGTNIYFNPNYLDLLKEEELDICILHCIMHIVLKHPFREVEYENKELYNLACDIVVNSNILYSISGVSNKKELVVLGKILPHKTPTGEEGYKYSTKEVYWMLLNGRAEKPKHNEQPLVQFVSSKRGKVYLRMFSLSKYFRNGDWKNMPLLDKQYDIHPNTFTFKKMEQLSYNKSNIEVKLLSNFESMPLPSYISFFPSRRSDVAPYTKANTRREDKYQYYFEKTTSKLIKELKENDFVDTKLKSLELEYRNFVYSTYLDINNELRDFFSNIITINNFSKNDENIVEKVCNYVKTSARYDLEFLITPSGKDYIIHFLTEAKVGLCRHFAAAACMFYRALGIPSRYTIGFLGSAKKNKTCTLSDKDLHAWVEIYVDNVGWMIVDPTPSSSSNKEDDEDDGDEGDGQSVDSFDGHKNWSEENSKNNKREQEINKRIMEAQELHQNYQKAGGHTNSPSSVPFILDKLKKPQLDWRVYLQNFIQENIVDYSFCPPDKRFSDGDFILPSFSEPDEEIKDILFMVDVSASMSDSDIITCFSEIQAAIEQFDGRISGHIGFFDAIVHSVIKFDGDTDIKEIKPVGRGGTNFDAVFEYVEKNMEDKLPASIIILSDGECDFPPQSVALGIPVLWVINNQKVNPPWGNVTRIGEGEDF